MDDKEIILLSLIPPSYIVVPNRDLRNIQFFTSAIPPTTLQMACLLVESMIDINVNKYVNNYDDVRGRFLSPNSINSRSASVLSKASTISYYKRIEIQNDFPDEEFREHINSSQLLHDDKSQESHHINIAIDPVFPQGPQCISNEILALNFLCSTHIDNDGVINIQLPYDSNQPMEPEL